MRSLLLGLVVAAAACSSSSATTPDGPLGSADAPIVMRDGPPGPDAPKSADAPKPADAPPGASPDAPPFPTVNLQPSMIASGLSQPLAIMIPPGETRFYAAEKTGTVSIIENGTPRNPAFIDIHGNVS